MRLLSFIIPCFCSEKTIESVVHEIEQTMKGKRGFTYEIILINDGSPDNTYETIRKLGKDNSKIRGISLSKNYGQTSANLAGYKHAQGDIIVGCDDDGQTPVNEVFKLVDKLDQGYDVVYAKYIKKKHSIFRNFASSINQFMATIFLKKPKGIRITSFYVMKTFVIQQLIRYTNPFPYLFGITIKTTDKIENIEVEHRERLMGKSKYTFKKLLNFWINGLTNYSTKLLRISLWIGLLFFATGLYKGLLLLLKKNPDTAAAGITTMILIIGGLILMAIGILGEYIGRVFISLNNVPQYVIRETINIKMKKNEN